MTPLGVIMALERKYILVHEKFTNFLYARTNGVWLLILLCRKFKHKSLEIFFPWYLSLTISKNQIH